MPIDKRLEVFVEKCLERNIPRPEIEAALREAGWPVEQIKGILSAYADRSFPIPVPRPRAPSSARDAYLYLLLFSTLYIAAWNLGNLIFEWLEYSLNDTSANTHTAWDESRSAIASLVITTPIYAYVSHVLRQALQKEPERRTSSVRKWLTYLTLFITASILIGDMISFLYTLLGGSLTTLYLLKFATVGIINTSVFGYYLKDMQRDERQLGG
ncbi:MAG: DUF5671 domain-containing protein [Methylococcaceae bacterium]